jgi:hypothetical protein
VARLQVEGLESRSLLSVTLNFTTFAATAQVTEPFRQIAVAGYDLTTTRTNSAESVSLIKRIHDAKTSVAAESLSSFQWGIGRGTPDSLRSFPWGVGR